MGSVKGRRRTVSPGTLGWLALGAFALLAAGTSPAGAVTTLRAFVIADVAAADPGDLVTYTLALDNVGPANAANAWANLTLPANSVHMWDTGLPPPCSAGTPSGNRRPYNCVDLPVGNNTFTVTVRLLSGPPDGTAMVATLAVNYTDDTGAPQAELVATAAVTMSIPVIELTKVPTTNPVDPGSALTYTISVRNTGSGDAATVWVNDTLPTEVTYGGVSLPPPRCPTRGPTDVECRFTGLAANGGSQTYDITASVGTTVTRGTAFLNWVFANFTDADGDLLPEVSTFAAVDVRVIRDLRLDKVATASRAYPGALVTFTIWYNNTATSPLGAAWINDSFPAGMGHDRSTPPGLVNGNTVRWQFPNVAVGANSIELVVAISASAANGTVLTNDVIGDYVDASGNRGLQVGSSASITVSDTLPRFEGFSKVAARATAEPGGTVRYTIHFNNTGRDTAGAVVIEDTAPPGTILTNPSVTPSASNGQWHRWDFVNVATGSHSLSYDLVFDRVSAGTTTVNFAFLNYTDSTGLPLPGAPPRSAIVRVVAGDGGGSTLLLLVGLGAVLAFGGFVAYRTFVRPPTVIDEVFLLHKDGLLIKHYTRRVRPDVDSDILSGMLIAVQNFVNESFIGSEGLQKEGQLDELRFGEFKLVIERGTWVIVAAVLSGDPTNRVKDEVKAAIRDLESSLDKDLESWSGDMRAVEGTDRFMQDLITGAYRGARGKG